MIPQIDVPGHSSGLLPLTKSHGLQFCAPYDPTTQAPTQLYDDPAGNTFGVVSKIYDELVEIFPDAVFDIGGDETHVSGNCTLANIAGFEEKVLKHLANKGKRGMGWEQIYKVTGAAQHYPSSIVRVYDSSPPVDKASPLLKNVTAAGQDVVVADSAAYYMNSCCPAVHGKKLCELGGYSDKKYSPFGPELCYYTNIADFDMGNLNLTTAERQHVLGGSASMWTDAYCATTECGAWKGVTPEAGWMAASPAHDIPFHDSLLAAMFPAAAVSAGAFYNYVYDPDMSTGELTQRWAVFNDAVLVGRGVRSCPNGCSCAEDNFCGKLYRPSDYSAPYGAVLDAQVDTRPVELARPSLAHLLFHEDNIGAISHFGMQTFVPKAQRTCAGKNGTGQWPLDQFDPVLLDTDQWVSTAASFGARYYVLVADHFSGFSLYNTTAHNYSVAHTKWRSGQADIIADFVTSCKKYGVRPAVYYSVHSNWYKKVCSFNLSDAPDGPHQQDFEDMAMVQLEELAARYGSDLAEIWFDAGNPATEVMM